MMGRGGGKKRRLVLGALLFIILLGQQAKADIDINPCNNILDELRLGGDLHLFYRYSEDPLFGTPLPTNNSDNSSYGEVLSKLRLTGVKNVGWTTLEAQVGGAFMATMGADFYGAFEDEVDVDLDTAYLAFMKPFSAPLDLKVGAQEIEIEKWFLVGSGRGQEAALWLQFHRSFPMAVKTDLFTESPLKATMFWAQSQNYFQQWDQWDPGLAPDAFGKDDVQVVGINLHLDITAETPKACLLPADRYPRYPFGGATCTNFYLYGGYYRKFDDSGLLLPGFSPVEGQNYLSENDTNAFDLGFDATFGGLNLEGEFVYEFGDAGELDGQNADRSAFGGFLGATYTFDFPMKPYLKVRYTYYSGDDDLNDDDFNDFDPMFSGFLGWQTWVMGEIVGEAQLPNTNKRDILVETGFLPKEGIKLSLAYLHHELDEPYYGAPFVGRIPVTDRDWGHELNLLADFDLHKNVFLHCGVGWATPEKAAEEIFGNDDSLFGQVWVWFKF